MALSFLVAPSDYLGLDHDTFKSDLLALSFSKPSEYIKLRKAVIQSLKVEFTDSIYSVFVNMLTKGHDKNDRPIDLAEKAMADYGGFKPNIPKQIVSEIALGIAKDFDEKINELVNKYLVPIDNLTLAHKQSMKIESGLRTTA